MTRGKDEKGYHLVKWETLILAMKDGGLAGWVIRYLRNLNRCLLMK